MLISVITINFNNCEGLRKTIQSVLNQTYQDFEYIIVDGGSTDGSKEIIERSFREVCGNIHLKWISEIDNGIYNAMNKGVRMATGDYCQFLNSGDTFFSSTVLEKVVKIGIETDIVVGNTMFSNGIKFLSPDEASLELFIHGSLSHPASYTKRELLLKNPFDESLKIVADMKFFLTSIVLDNATYQPLDVMVARFVLDGISCKQQELRLMERNEVLKSLIPARILSDYRKFLGDTDEYYKLYTTVYSSRLKWILYNISLFFTKLCSINRGWVKDFHYHRQN